METDRVEIERLAKEVVDSIIKVHSTLGPGLLESAYHACLRYEIEKRGSEVQCETSVPICYDGQIIDHGYRADMIVDQKALIENKVVAAISKVHRAQLLTYLKLSNLIWAFWSTGTPILSRTE
jgi:GxxExxY protein